jgi:hypothetical protein
VTQQRYSREQAAAQLAIPVSTLDVQIGIGRIRVERQGRRVFILHSELERFAGRSFAFLWPAKQNGKTVRGYRYGAPRRARMHEIDLQLEHSEGVL